MEWTSSILAISLIVNGLLFSIVVKQTKGRSKSQKKQLDFDPFVQDDAFEKSIREKVTTIGTVPTVKFLRETYGLSLLEAKQLVDRVSD